MGNIAKTLKSSQRPEVVCGALNVACDIRGKQGGGQQWGGEGNTGDTRKVLAVAANGTETAGYRTGTLAESYVAAGALPAASCHGMTTGNASTSHRLPEKKDHCRFPGVGSSKSSPVAPPWYQNIGLPLLLTTSVSKLRSSKNFHTTNQTRAPASLFSSPSLLVCYYFALSCPSHRTQELWKGIPSLPRLPVPRCRKQKIPRDVLICPHLDITTAPFPPSQQLDMADSAPSNTLKGSKVRFCQLPPHRLPLSPVLTGLQCFKLSSIGDDVFVCPPPVY